MIRPRLWIESALVELRAEFTGWKHTARVLEWESHCVNVHKKVWDHQEPLVVPKLQYDFVVEILNKAAREEGDLPFPDYMRLLPMVPVHAPSVLPGGPNLDRPNSDLYMHDIWLTDKTSQPAPLLHELAHIVEREKNHGTKWIHRYIEFLGWAGLNKLRLIKDAQRYRILPV